MIEEDDILRAAEYVLGTLDEDQRREVAQALESDPELRREVRYWERRLSGLALALEPVDPPADLWPRIRRAAGLASGRRFEPRSYRLWQGVAAAASLATAILAGLLYVGLPEPQPTAPKPAYATVLRDDPTGAGWLVTAEPTAEAVEVTTLKGYPVPQGKSLELWLMPPEGKPVSLGLMPNRGERHLTVPEDARPHMSGKSKLAVSLEPAGGSPTGQPTGEVLWVEPITAASS